MNSSKHFCCYSEGYHPTNVVYLDGMDVYVDDMTEALLSLLPRYRFIYQPPPPPPLPK